MPVARPAIELRHIYRTQTSTGGRHVSSLPSRREVLQPQPQPTVSSDDGHSTLRLRQHGNKSLPLPPLLDPIRIAAEQRHTAPKSSTSSAEQTDFQRQLAANPFAQALATPIRQCHLTRVRLPTHFLQPFTASIAPSPPPDTQAQKGRPNDRPITVSLLPQPKHQLSASTNTLPASTYALRTRPVIQHLSKKHNWSRIVGQRMREQYARRIGRKKDDRNVDAGREWVWDAQMADIVCENLRTEVVQLLEQCVGDDAAIWDWPPWLLPLESTADVAERREDIIAVLLSAQQPRPEALPEHVLVYPMENLLDPEGSVTALRKWELDHFGGCAILADRSDRRATQLLMALHRLDIYRAHDDAPGGEAKTRAR